VSSDKGDDAAAYRLPDGRALLATVDFFTPIVDDPYDWGRIAATNAFSDVYAMGGRPVIALNVAGWPADGLPLDLLARVLQGGQDVAGAAGAVVLGGHTIDDREPKYGMVAIGFADADRLLRNSTAPPGARLFLTKPIGLGLIATAIKNQRATEEQSERAVEVMTTLNAAASEAALEAEAEAATDVTGFGLLGHLHTLLAASGVAARVDAPRIPLLEGVVDLARAGVVPGGTRRNHEYLRGTVNWGGLTEPEQLVLADAQTSGGLLIVARRREPLAQALDARGIAWAEIGVVVDGPAGRIDVTGNLSALRT
jgi:selenide, water dikinase